MAAVEVIMTSLITALGISQMQSGIDFWRTCYEFPPEFTEIIDKFLKNSANSKITSKIINSKGYHVPREGYHYYYLDNKTWLYYIPFYKRRHESDFNYLCYVAPKQRDTFLRALSEIFYVPNNVVRTISIDTSGPFAFALIMEKKCFSPRFNQTKAIEIIHKNWSINDGKQISVCITGERGIGKTSIGKLLKKYIDTDMGLISKLYDDFNPTLNNCTINRLILRRSSEYTPVIIVMDEIDLLFDIALTENTRVEDKSHCKNKQTFLTMLDNISNNCNTIAIYTTEKSFDQLCEKEEYASFIRKGRIDMIINMTEGDCECIKR